PVTGESHSKSGPAARTITTAGTTAPATITTMASTTTAIAPITTGSTATSATRPADTPSFKHTARAVPVAATYALPTSVATTSRAPHAALGSTKAAGI